MIGLALLTALAAAPAPAPPDDATLVYYNARLALREGKPKETLQLWLLRNAIESDRGALSAHDEDFLSLTWVALGDLGLCSDGISFDRRGAGLWPLALHNWFLRNRRRAPPPDRPGAFEAFELSRQKRYIGLDDVLGAEELRRVRFFRTDCARMKDVLADAGRSVDHDPGKTEVGLTVIENLLDKSLRTMAPGRVRGRALVEARLLDLRLSRILEYERQARRRNRSRRRDAKRLEVDLEPTDAVARSAGMRRLLAVADGWTVDDWLALDASRRLFLYDRVARAADPTPEAAAFRLQVIDRLVADKRGAEVQAWIAYVGESDADRRAIWAGERGQALLGLDRSAGFRERAAIALHRGVDHLGAGRLPDALRALAFTLHHAGESTQAETVRRLALRWLAYVAARFEVTDELMAMLVTLVPRGDLSFVLESLLWEAAFRADRASFTRIADAQRGRGALRARVDRLRPLAAGDVGAFVEGLRAELVDTPYAALRFTRRLLDRLQRQDGETRRRHRGTLEALRRALDGLPEETRAGYLRKRIDALDLQILALLEGLPARAGTRSARDRARDLAPTGEVFAGRVRLAPSDPLPWPFPRPANLRAPSVFEPVPMTPVEWREGGTHVLGWRLGR